MHILLYITVPTPSVALTAPNNQTVGQPLTLQCEVTTVRGIDIGVDIVWSSDDGELQTINNTTPTTTDNTFMFKDNYTILLSTSDEDRVIRCEVVINLNPLVMASNITTLNVTGEYSNMVKHATIFSMHSSYSWNHHITIWSHTRSYGR